jgi:DNA replicative helicase MCM subunit Mcm2 (Cdc46/Mcm family)
MKKSISDLLKTIIPLKKEKKEKLNQISNYFTKEEIKDLSYLLKLKKIEINNIKISTNEKDSDLKQLIKIYNNKIKNIQTEKKINTIEEKTENKLKEIINLIAPNIYGHELIKKATALQLFAQKTHILILGDPGTGKTDILRSICNITPKSIFGLGSGTSGAGLSVTISGKEITPGILPQANEGICAIDELNLLKKEDSAALYNAMEKGFITYDKKNQHLKFDAHIRILATANPKGDKFKGTFNDFKKQIPFDSALLSRFGLIFIVLKPSTKEFLKIAQKIMQHKKTTKEEEDYTYIKKYIEKKRKIKVTISKEYELKILNFIEHLKEDEDKFITEISPRLVKTIIDLTKASAKLNNRKTIIQNDLDTVFEIIKYSLFYLHNHFNKEKEEIKEDPKEQNTIKKDNKLNNKKENQQKTLEEEFILG